MSLDWATNENPISSSKMRKMTIRHLTTAERDAIVDADLEVGDIIYNITTARHEWLSQKTPSRVWKVLGGGGSLDYSGKTSYKGTLAHFEDSRAGVVVTIFTDYALIADGEFRSNTIDTDEFRHHSVKQSTAQTNLTEFGDVATKAVPYFAKGDIDNTFTKVTLQMRLKLGLRQAGLRHFYGLNLGDSPMNSNTTRKICLTEANGNFFLRTSDGTTQSDLDTGTVGDTSVHKWDFVWQSGSVEIKLDGVSKGIKTTNLPTTALNVAFATRNDTGGTVTPNDVLDYWHYKLE